MVTIFSFMAFRSIIISKASKINLDLNNIVVTYEGEPYHINMDEISTIIIDDPRCLVSLRLLSELCIKGINVIFTDESHKPVGSLTTLYNNVRTPKKHLKQINWDNNLKGYLWTNIVKEKIAACYQRSNSSDSVATDYHTKIKGVLEYMKVLLMIVHQARIDRKEDIIKFTERQSGIYRFTQFFEEDVLQSASEFARKYGLLPMAHLICLPTDTELDLKVQQANVSDVRMIEVLFAYTKYIQDHLTWEGRMIEVLFAYTKYIQDHLTWEGTEA